MSERDRGIETDPRGDRSEPGIEPDAARREPGIDPDAARREPGIDPHLDLKIGLFFLAAVLGIAGIILGRTLPIFAAMVAIGAGLLLRFLRSPGGGDGAPRGKDLAPRGEDQAPRREDQASAGDEAS